jgi:hypothetical protein
MSLWDTLPVGPPVTVQDWAAFRELHRHDLSSLDIKTLAALYGFSSLLEYRDDDCLQRIEQMMNEAGDPVRARYDLAWNLGEFFDDEYFYRWRIIYTPEELARLEALRNGSYGTVPRGRLIRPDEPGYVSEIPAELHSKVVNWLVEGIDRFRDDEELFQHIRTISARALAGDTFLDDADIEQLRRASDDELSLRTDKRAQEMIGKFIKDFNQAMGRNEDGTDE